MNWRVIYSYLLYTWGGLHRYFGNQNVLSGEFERAVHYFGRAYELNPQFTYARLQRAVLLGRELQRYDEALAEFDALLAEEPENGAALVNKALVLQVNGRYQEALNSLETYLQLPDQDEYRREANRIAEQLRAIIAELDEEA